MFPPQKLRELPASQCLRKTGKILQEFITKFHNQGFIHQNELIWALEILEICKNFITAKPAYDEAIEILNKACSRNNNSIIYNTEINRQLITVQFLIQRETGNYPSEWDFDTTGESGGLDPAKRRVFKGMNIYLEDIRSPFNIGSIFRTAESFGAEKIWLSPNCADPEHRRAKRTAMGCVPVMPWARIECDPFTVTGPSPDAAPFSAGAGIFALETGGTAVENFTFPRSGVMIIGSEELGVSPKALEKADASLGRVSVQVFGAKGSLNVSVAFGIAMHAWAAAMNRTQ